MDTETIQQLIAAFKELGGDAKSAFIWYLVITYMPRWIWAIGGVWMIGTFLAYLSSEVRDMSLQHRLRDAAGLAGVFWSNDSDQARLLAIIRKHWKDEA